MRRSRMIEALLFASEAPLTASDLARADESLDEDEVELLLAELKQEYDAEERAFTIAEIAGGYQLLTRPEYAGVLERYDTVPTASRLSSAALETLAIIAYRQPVGRAEVEEIRGVGAGGVLKTLLERGLVEVVGRGEGLGGPLLYGTTRHFLEHFGFRSLEDLRGHALAVGAADSPQATLIPLGLLREAGLEPRRDVDFGEHPKALFGEFIGDADEGVKLRVELRDASQQGARQFLGGETLFGKVAGDLGKRQVVHVVVLHHSITRGTR